MEETATKYRNYVHPKLEQEITDYQDHTRSHTIHHSQIQQTLGQLFIQARAFHKLSLSDVAKQLYLTEDKILAIEQDQLDTFDAPIYVRGHIEGYAKLVGIPKNIWQPLLAKLGYQTAPIIKLTESDPIQIKRSIAKLNKPSGYQHRQQKQQTRLWLIAGVIFVVFLLACWWGFHRSSKKVANDAASIPLKINQGT